MWQQRDYIASLWAFVAITLIFVCIRVYVRLTSVNRPWREILVVLAWILFLLYASGMTLLFYRYHFYRILTDFDTDLSEYMTDDEIIWQYKVFFMLDFTFPQLLNFCKAVLLLTYQDLCSRDQYPKIWLLIMLTWVILICHEVGIFFIYEFVECLPAPLSTIWSITELCPGRYPGFLLTEWSVALATDVLCYVIPIFIVYQLRNISIIQRIGVASMFCVGFIHAAFTAWYIFTIVSPKEYTPAGNGRSEFVQLLIPASAIMVVCIPQLRLLGRWKLVKSITLTFSTTINEIKSKKGLRSTSMRTTVTTMDPDATSGAKARLVDEEKAAPPPQVVQTDDATDIESPRSPEPTALRPMSGGNI